MILEYILKKKIMRFKKSLKRNIQDKVIAGVCSGLADYFEVDVILIRLIFILGTISAFPFLLAYIVLWVITPVNEVEIKNFADEKYSDE